MALTTQRGRRARPPVRSFTAALTVADVAGARSIVQGYFARAGSRIAVMCDLFQPAQYRIGELWYQGQLGIAEEHRATAIVAALARELPPTPSGNPVRPGARCVLAGPAGELHDIGLWMLTVALEDEGWMVDLLAPPTPRAELLRVVAASRPDVVGLSAAYLPTTRELAATIADLKRLDVPVVVGGPLFNRAPDVWQHLGADAHGTDARMAAQVMRKLLR